MSIDPMLTKITLFSHHFTIVTPSRPIISIIYKMSQDYTQFGVIFDKKSKRKKWAPLRTFGLYVDHGREFRFHIGQFEEFIERLNVGRIDPTTYEIVKTEIYKPEIIDLNVRDGWNLYEEQKEAKAFVVDDRSEGNSNVLLMMPTGSGKLQPNTSPVKVPGGWKAIGELQLRDPITAKDGTETYVTGIYPQGEVPIYEIVFEDGRSTLCGLDHLWKVTTSEKRNWTKVIKTIEIARLLNLPTYKDRLYIDFADSEVIDDVQLPIDPYVLGVILGDGGISNNAVVITKADEELFTHLKERLPSEVKINIVDHKTRSLVKASPEIKFNAIKKALSELGLMGKRAWEKQIPDLYLNASTKQRLDLVRGLLDTDGTVDRDNGTISYTSTSIQLAKGFQYLIRSLGGYAKITERVPSYSYKGDKKLGRVAYTVFVRYKKPSDLFLLQRKRVRTKDDGQYVATLKLRIKSVKYHSHQDSRCISVAKEDKLYITDDFIVTHNTVTGLSATAELKHRFAVIVLAMYVEKWIKDIMEILEIERDEIYVVQGSDSLMRATNFPASGLPLPKAFVISVTTMNSWYKLYEADRNNPLLEAYACMPYDFWQHLGIGTQIYDEAHQHPHAVYKSHLFSHVPKSISLSATLLTKDPTLKRVQSMMFPRFKRFDKVKMKKYITAHACAYQIYDFQRTKLRTTEYGQQTYSHAAFEKSILANKTIKSQYFKMISNLAADGWYKIKQPGDKLLIFVATKIMAAALVRHLKGCWSHLDIRQYLQENDLCDILEPDICVTTMISGGTAIDIKGLRTTIMTISIDSPIQNVQGMGRLREIKHRNHNTDVHFYYLYCSTIPKQVEYHNNKVDLFKDRVLEHRNEFLNTIYP